ncbi:MAG TPA: 50S ribosomal protein L29 [bacterium]|nr:50S ribosomal protein L29 [bacterium]
MKKGLEDMRNLSVTELNQKILENKEKLLQLKFQKKQGQLKNALEIRFRRREIARIKTVAKEKQK